jgi:hypothetical protein
VAAGRGFFVGLFLLFLYVLYVDALYQPYHFHRFDGLLENPAGKGEVKQVPVAGVAAVNKHFKEVTPPESVPKPQFSFFSPVPSPVLALFSRPVKAKRHLRPVLVYICDNLEI